MAGWRERLESHLWTFERKYSCSKGVASERGVCSSNSWIASGWWCESNFYLKSIDGVVTKSVHLVARLAFLKAEILHNTAYPLLANSTNLLNKYRSVFQATLTVELASLLPGSQKHEENLFQRVSAAIYFRSFRGRDFCKVGALQCVCLANTRVVSQGYFRHG